MADGIVNILLGGEEESDPKRREPDSTDVVDPVATVLAMDEVGLHSKVAEAAAEYLIEQRQLAERQRRLLNDKLERADQERRTEVNAARLKFVADLVKLGLQVSLAIIGAAAAIGLGIMLVNAVRAHSVIVEEFKSPAVLAPRGLTGDVVASGVLDELQKLQEFTRSTEPSLTLSNAWSSDIEIEIPETHASIGEIDKLLRKQFGNDFHIYGDLVVESDGELALTVRGIGVTPKTFTGPNAELARLYREAGEYIYGRSQPTQLLVYYLDQSRWDDIILFARDAITRADTDELRARILTSWGNALVYTDNPIEGTEKLRSALLFDPHLWAAYTDLNIAAWKTDGEEGAYRQAQDFLRLVAETPLKDRPKQSYLINAAQSLWDMPLMLKANLDEFTDNRGRGSSNMTAASGVAQTYAIMHDRTLFKKYIVQSDPEAPETQFFEAAGEAILMLQATARPTDVTPLLKGAQAMWKVWGNNKNLQINDDSLCFAGYVFGLTGHSADSTALFNQMGPYSLCEAFRGSLAERAGSVSTAEAIWAEAIAKGPSEPFVYMERGQSRLRRGDMSGAEADFGTAHQRTPKFADPLKLWGDLLSQEGRWKDAAAKYKEALDYAPEWPALKEAHAKADHRP